MASVTSPSSVNTQGSPTQAPAEKPSPPPIDILPSQLAQAYSYVHPAVLLGLYAYRFEALVADPVRELLADLPWLAALQISFVMLCLPPAGSTSTEAGAGAEEEKKKAPKSPSGPLRHGKPGYRRKHSSGKSSWACFFAKLMPAFLSFALTSLLATPLIAVLLVLFGAPLTTHNAETILCAAHMALLSATGLVYVHGVEASVWKEVWGIARPVDAVWGSALGTGLGAWFGAIPIPLDWDRPWQAFPITILTGAYIGYAVGSLVSRTPLLYGKRIEFAPEQAEEEEKKTN
ncbi:Glycosylphosphatidylinositol anchor biosynthesis protein 11 [Penicillium subrubescens]|uniref:Glycosylphosphatidylinositol anchor biosynthesis protein 11 n=1 Tax=Penicillium subrubescens TaxID=1316194 RepID=A0A1Q5T829_9EURO|nr:Glycosylphosphatidylinositol anchor biosynthesis protein 11 [Penicillium subrubescens]KAJ5911935.1 Glycosylphosphatidylinositol anchor biosynthesis protein 11 [Penicillium subrubescens]OKO96392.1 Glycosylphosphatidylinositol anchor biosynthesis protein 11 [Penicillium subrubescens]